MVLQCQMHPPTLLWAAAFSSRKGSFIVGRGDIQELRINMFLSISMPARPPEPSQLLIAQFFIVAPARVGV